MPGAVASVLTQTSSTPAGAWTWATAPFRPPRQLFWASVDSPWASVADREKFLGTVRPVKEMDPELVLSTHLPPAAGIGLIARMIDTVGLAPGLEPFVGPDQQALEQLLAGFEPSGSAAS